MSATKDTESDSHLLQLFATEGDEQAFCRLVERHASLVRGVAWRCLGDACLVDEVSQNVFSLLAQRAASVSTKHVGGWLYHTACLTAKNARRSATRYRKALNEMGQDINRMKASNSARPDSDSTWEEIRPNLDDAISTLSEKMRRPLIMRFFEDRSICEIASLTGRSEAAIRKAIDRALERLSGILNRRGITTTGSALGIMLAGQNLLAPTASAAALAATAIQEASSITAVATTSSTSALLSKTILIMTTSQTTVITVATITLAAIPAVYFWRANTALKEEMRELQYEARAQVDPATPSVSKPPVPSITENHLNSRPKAKPTPSSPTNGAAAALAALFSPDAILKRAEDDAVKDAARDTERISLYLPELTDAQKEQVRSALENHNWAKLEKLKDAFETGAFDRVMNHPETATNRDRELMAEAAPSDPPSRDNDPLASVLTSEQFETYWQKQEEKRVSDAEASAATALQFLNQSLDLSAEQKDRIFEGLAQLELAPLEGGKGPGNSFVDDRLREEAKEQILRQHMNPNQVELIEKRLGEFKQGIENLLQSPEE